MKKQILLTHQTITALKALSPARERGFIRLVWAILEHALRQSQKGKAEEVGIVKDIRQFVEHLNDKYPNESVTSVGCENHFKLEERIR
ncbi:hypothetical protein L9X51_17885 [Vibrio aestuarianus]|uniref:Uncharacterized protein n=1 Tax=Vibrio aestuarianus TaxID=28171 RepID=A0A9X4IYJ5_9VIBR|nr:hypothetical protein [Vibrio aestuarianus]MDE1348254.1 hypothetical protein [Vibrio aestuarianus]NGZ65195.1 hypothetical protein [Vibrio aestuarianus subsp. cardii]